MAPPARPQMWITTPNYQRRPFGDCVRCWPGWAKPASSVPKCEARARVMCLVVGLCGLATARDGPVKVLIVRSLGSALRFTDRGRSTHIRSHSIRYRRSMRGPPAARIRRRLVNEAWRERVFSDSERKPKTKQGAIVRQRPAGGERDRLQFTRLHMRPSSSSVCTLKIP